MSHTSPNITNLYALNREAEAHCLRRARLAPDPHEAVVDDAAAVAELGAREAAEDLVVIYAVKTSLLLQFVSDKVTLTAKIMLHCPIRR